MDNEHWVEDVFGIQFAGLVSGVEALLKSIEPTLQLVNEVAVVVGDFLADLASKSCLLKLAAIVEEWKNLSSRPGALELRFAYSRAEVFNQSDWDELLRIFGLGRNDQSDLWCLLEARPDLWEASNPKAYMRKSIRNLRIKRAARDENSQREPLDSAPRDELGRLEAHSALTQVRRALPIGWPAEILLFRAEGHSWPEIRQLMGWTDRELQVWRKRWSRFLRKHQHLN